tara:strand:+ start:35659 stop:36252 length:594 start_codon:yes stop_codon:yes gene_type:complete
MTQAFPLHWPEGWPRTAPHRRQASKFKPGGTTQEAQYVRDELARLGARHVVISSNISLRNDGLPYSNQRRVTDTGVAVYFEREGQSQCIPCDRWSTVEENLRAVWKSIEALRGMDRWGAKNFVDAAFKGFQALPPPGGKPWKQVLREHGVIPETPEQVNAMYRRLAAARHPDKVGGSESAMAELNAAREQALKELQP